MNLNYEQTVEGLCEERLRIILEEEFIKPNINVELIKNVTTALETKTGDITICDVDAAWQDFTANWTTNEPLYDYEELEKL